MRHALKVHVALVTLFLYAPLVVLVVYSFSASRFALRMEGFTLEWYRRALSNPAVYKAVVTSFSVAFLSAALSTGLGTALALAIHSLRRAKVAGKALLAMGAFPLLAPEIVLGLGLLLFFSRFLRPSLLLWGLELGSFPSVVAGHVTLGIGYVMYTVRARLEHFDDAQLLAAHDLGASRPEAFWTVMFPQILPGIIAGACLSLAVSLDDFYVSYFVSVGGSGFQTLPLYFWNLQGRQALTPEINVVSTLLLGFSFLFVLSAFVLQKWLRAPGEVT
ncbi:MAG: ABC transporter permease [Silvanigrellales bacterium]|nr:ABC transporter permease [Silvanigrellales bacterium]